MAGPGQGDRSGQDAGHAARQHRARRGGPRGRCCCRRPLRYAGTDMLCYRADWPEELVARQTARWDPVTDWLATTFGARLVLAEGVIHQEQPAAAIAAIGKAFALFHDPCPACLPAHDHHAHRFGRAGARLCPWPAVGGRRLAAGPSRRGLEHRIVGYRCGGRGTPAQPAGRVRAATATFKAAGQKS